MPQSQVQEIKEKLDIVEVVQNYINLDKAGANYRARCPFHSEKTPSFFVSPSKQIFKCFGCGAGGSVFDFVMKIEGVEFKDALYILAKQAGVELKRSSKQERTKRQRLGEILEISCLFFEKQLTASRKGKQAKKYILNRNISEQSIKKWRLGYSPDKWQALSDFLVGRGFKRGEVVNAGLAVESKKSSRPYDRFRGRIIFPVFGLQGRVIGFGGRVFEKKDKDEIAKYINTPNTPLYDKSRTLYGLNFAKVPIRKNNRCILTEGYTDVILSHQAGFEETVASSGTSLTKQQLKILKRYSDNLLTAFDMDRAGNLATKKGINMAQNLDFEVKVITMPKDSDPADIIAESKQKWRKLLDNAREIMQFYFENVLQNFDRHTPQGKKKIAKNFLPRVAQLSNKITQAHWLQKMARELEVPEEAAAEELKKVSLNKSRSSSASQSRSIQQQTPQQEESKSRKRLLEEQVLSVVLNSPQTIDSIKKEHLKVFSSPIKTALAVFKKKKPHTPDQVEQVIDHLSSNPEIKQLLASCSMLGEVAPEQEPEQELQLCLRELKKLVLKNKLNHISRQIKLAEQKGLSKKVEKLINNFNKITQKIYECEKEKIK